MAPHTSVTRHCADLSRAPGRDRRTVPSSTGVGAADVRFVVTFRGVRTRPAALLIAAIALASACTGSSGKPQVLPSITATPSATATPVVVPSAATVHDSFGAAAFVRFYYAQLNEAWGNGDPDALAGLSSSECGTCANYVKAAEKFRDDKQHVQGASVHIVSAEAPPEQNGIVAVDVFFDEPARSIVDAAGKTVRSFAKSGTLHWTMYVQRTAAGWVLRAAVKSK